MYPMNQPVVNNDATRTIGETGQAKSRAIKMDPAEESILLQRCLANDRRAWDTLVRQYEKCVFRFAFALCHDRDDAEDISAQVFIRVFQNLHTFRNEASFSSWLFRIVRNTHLDMCVRPSWRNTVSLDSDGSGDLPVRQSVEREIADPTPGPESLSIRHEVMTLLNTAVKHLPAYQREVLRLYHGENKSYCEIAEATGLSIGTVKSRINRARAMLRERLTPYRETFVSN